MEQPPLPAPRFSRPRLSRLPHLGLLLACSGCSLTHAPPPEPTPPMPVQAPLRKQVLQGYMPFGSIGWVNNKQVVFSGRPIGQKQRNSLYVWDAKKPAQLLLEHSPGGCISGRTILATQLSEHGRDRRISLEAPNFAIRPLIGSQAPAKSKFDPISCSSITTPRALENRVWKPLRKGTGFLDFGPHEAAPRNQPVRHLAGDMRTIQDTGIRMEQPLLPQAVHADHDDSYLIFDLHQSPREEENWLETNNRTIWRLDRQMKGAPLNVPAGPWVGVGSGTIAFLPARPGLLITSNNFARHRAAGGAGLYLLPKGGAAQRLERGLVQEAAVSPDGCRVAYGFKPRLDTGIPEGGPRLVVLDLCDAGTRANR